MKVLAKGLLLVLSVTAGIASAEQTRWYSDEQIAQGKPLFQKNCVACHGQQGQGAPKWTWNDRVG